jgi:hypothetical protein
MPNQEITKNESKKGSQAALQSLIPFSHQMYLKKLE